MFTQVNTICKKFPTLSAATQLFSSVTYFVPIQMLFCHKPFLTHRTHIRLWPVIMWMLSDIITISFSLNLKGTFSCDLNFKRTLTCTICTTLDTIKTDSDKSVNDYCTAMNRIQNVLASACPSVRPCTRLTTILEHSSPLTF